jgi:hypothetical protein
MAMLYRHHNEFAVGHGISVHTEASKDSSDSAVRIESVISSRFYEVTTNLPAADRGRRRARTRRSASWPGLVLDMKVLAESDAKKLIDAAGTAGGSLSRLDQP